MTQVLPYPLDAGPKVRAYHMLRHLSARHAVTLVSFVRPDDPPEAVAHLAGICAAVHAVPIRRSAWRNIRAGLKGLLTGLPMTIVRDEIAEMAALVRRLAVETHFDVIHADQLSMAWWGQLAVRTAAAAGRAPRSLLDEHNAIYLLTERMAATEANPLRKIITRREAHAFRRYEAAMCRAYDAVLTVTDEDRGRLSALLEEKQEPASKIAVIPICVDPAQVAVVARQPGGPKTILHLGTMFWPPNVAGVLWFAREVLPLIHAQEPDARFVIVGKNPPPEVMALAADSRIQVTGYVADVTPHLAAADVFVVPLHAGGGMRVKILDAWQWGLPVVSTPIGAEGIDLRDGENILIARPAMQADARGDATAADAAASADAVAFADATVRLLSDSALNARLRAAGRAWVEATYSWQAIYQRVDAVYDRF